MSIYECIRVYTSVYECLWIDLYIWYLCSGELMSVYGQRERLTCEKWGNNALLNPFRMLDVVFEYPREQKKNSWLSFSESRAASRVSEWMERTEYINNYFVCVQTAECPGSVVKVRNARLVD